jgi:hypothetical protein
MGMLDKQMKSVTLMVKQQAQNFHEKARSELKAT